MQGREFILRSATDSIVFSPCRNGIAAKYKEEAFIITPHNTQVRRAPAFTLSSGEAPDEIKLYPHYLQTSGAARLRLKECIFSNWMRTLVDEQTKETLIRAKYKVQEGIIHLNLEANENVPANILTAYTYTLLNQIVRSQDTSSYWILGPPYTYLNQQ